MYIEIADEIGTFLHEKTESTQDEDKKILKHIMDLLDNAKISFRERKHCINTESEDCAKEITKYALSKGREDIALLFNYIAENFYSYMGDLKNKVECYFRIVVNDKEKNTAPKSNARYISVDEAAFSKFWQETLFLPENINDCKFFITIASILKRIEGDFDAIHFSFSKEQAGGSGITDTFLIKCAEGKFVLAILDSDRNFPEDIIRPDSTAGKFLSKKDHFLQNGDYLILNVHEMENLFSGDCFLECLGNKTVVEKLKSCEKEVRQFYNFKDGYSYKSISKNEYMKSKLPIEFTPCDDHTSIEECRIKGRGCSKTLINGFGGDGLMPVIFTGDWDSLSSDQIESKARNDFQVHFPNAYESLIPEIQEEWKHVYSKVLTWLCSYTSDIGV